MEDREVGISYTEFSYMLLQALDFLHLRREFECELQIGGSDQWGNITMGIDLIRKKGAGHAFGLTLPLITKADGTKFGKTEAGTVWLDPRKTSVYRFYQFWINSDDRDVIRQLKYFTFLERGEIAELEAAHAANPGAREAHRALARAATRLIHGEDQAEEARRASEILFGGGIDGIRESTFREIADEVPGREIPSARMGGEGIALVDLLVEAGLSSSKGQARKDIQGGGIYLNNERQVDAQFRLAPGQLLFGRHILLRKGKRNYAMVTLNS
jgi:tyrosyl-tRNA synthetase